MPQDIEHRMDLHEAMTQISEIRQQMARSEVFRGYRAATAAISGALAVAAATTQALCLPDPLHHQCAYLAIWVSVAVFSAGLAAAEMILRQSRAASGSKLGAQVNWLFVGQFLPCMVAGALLTYVIMKFDSENASMLPGLWALLFSMGIYASCRLLPRATIVVGGYYLIAGLACLAVFHGAAAFSPWVMLGIFGVGQFMTAGILYWNLERPEMRRAAGD